MGKPTLTPHTDMLEKVIPEFIAACNREAGKEGHDPVIAALSVANLPAVLRAIAMQRDLLVPLPHILDALHATMANTIMSAACTLGNLDQASCPAAMWNVAAMMIGIDAAIQARFADVTLDTEGSTAYRYDNPDLAPGRA